PAAAMAAHRAVMRSSVLIRSFCVRTGAGGRSTTSASTAGGRGSQAVITTPPASEREDRKYGRGTGALFYGLRYIWRPAFLLAGLIMGASQVSDRQSVGS